MRAKRGPPGQATNPQKDSNVSHYWVGGRAALRAFSGVGSRLRTAGWPAPLSAGTNPRLLSLSAVFAHWGSVIVPLGYTDPAIFATGNPYGSTWLSGGESGPDELTLHVARHQVARLTRWARQALLDPALAHA